MKPRIRGEGSPLKNGAEIVGSRAVECSVTGHGSSVCRCVQAQLRLCIAPAPWTLRRCHRRCAGQGFDAGSLVGRASDTEMTWIAASVMRCSVHVHGT
eukprot:1103141-Rhodomonas_salina.1